MMWVNKRDLGVSEKLRGPIMNFNDQDRYCHPERSEGSRPLACEILRCAQDDKILPISVVHVHNRRWAR